MAQHSNIAWTDATWNPVRGCSRISPGCQNCYAEVIAARFSKTGQAYEGLAYRNESGAHWTGRTVFIEKMLDWPLHQRKAQRIFVNSMSDLFHESVSITHQTDIFEVMAKCPHLTFQVLTKRADLMMSRMKEIGVGVAYRLGQQRTPNFWPLPNVQLLVSIENQETADERIDFLVRTKASVRGLSVEPLLGAIDLRRHLTSLELPMPAWSGEGISEKRLLDWVIVGGESGPSFRPMEISWLETIVAQCKSAGVPVFVKQDSGKRPGLQGRIPDELWIHEFPLSKQ